MSNLINKFIRQMSGKAVEDPSSIQNNSYNEAVGAQKNMEMGHHLLPIPNGSASYTTDLSTITTIKPGTTIALYNNSGTVRTVTLGDSTVVSQAAGAVQAGTDFVGIPLAINSWTYIATYNKTHVVTSNAAVLCFIVKDETYISNQKYRS